MDTSTEDLGRFGRNSKTKGEEKMSMFEECFIAKQEGVCGTECPDYGTVDCTFEKKEGESK